MGAEGDRISRLKRSLLQPDIADIRKTLAAASTYTFAVNLRERMDKKGLSANALGPRCDVKRAAVDKWLHGKSRPGSKEQMKKLGMSLGMDAAELDTFLLLNAYPRLYDKNPFDILCKRVLKNHAGANNVVALYNKEIENHSLKQMAPPENRVSIATSYLSKSLSGVDSGTEFHRWLEDNKEYFAAADKSMLPSGDFRRFISLFLQEKTLNRRYISGELPASMRGPLYSIKGNKEVTVRGLREKLVIFGLYSNMAVEDFDTMLKLAKLRPFSQPGTKVEIAILEAVRCGHMRYPYYEFDSLWQRHSILVNLLSGCKIQRQKPPSLYVWLQKEYQKRLNQLEPYTLYYDAHQGEYERKFEQYYTDIYDTSEKRLLHYVHDILLLLAEKGSLPEKETAEILQVLETVRAAAAEEP